MAGDGLTVSGACGADEMIKIAAGYQIKKGRVFDPAFFPIISIGLFLKFSSRSGKAHQAQSKQHNGEGFRNC
jgi:hypothetical protein